MRRILLLAIAAALVASAQETRYEFEHIEVDYAMSFEADPFDREGDDWATNASAGGSINVTFGSVTLHRGDGTSFGEGFLRVDGPLGSQRFLVNGAAWDWDENGTHPSLAAWFFWSAKQVVDDAVVKNFTLPIQSAALIQHFVDGRPVAIELWTSDDGDDAGSGLWWQDPVGTGWQARMETLRSTGDPLEGAA